MFCCWNSKKSILKVARYTEVDEMRRTLNLLVKNVFCFTSWARLQNKQTGILESISREGEPTSLFLSLFFSFYSASKFEQICIGANKVNNVM